MWQNLVSSASFLIIMHLILMCLHVIWRAQCNERPAMCCSFAFRVFHYVVTLGTKAELGEFCFVSYHIILDSNIFTCNVKGLVRWEAYDVPFFHILMFSLCSGYNLGVAELGEFCFVSYHLILHSNLYVCCLMSPWDERHRLHCSITFQGFFYHSLFFPCLFAL